MKYGKSIASMFSMMITTTVAGQLVIPGPPQNFTNPNIDYYIARQSKTLSSINEIPWYCAYLAQLTLYQPVFNGTGIQVVPSKVLSLESADDCTITAIVNNNASVLFSDKQAAWNLVCYASGAQAVYTFYGKQLANILVLSLSNVETLASYNKLENKYKKVINNLKTGWQLFTSKSAADEYELTGDLWYIFSKDTKNFSSAADLVSALLDKFQLSGVAFASQVKNSTYLYVSEGNVALVNQYLDFNLSTTAS
jgi:hypothetical protein